MRSFLVAVSGAQREILARCPTERPRFDTLGLAVLISSGIAGISMWFALDNVLNVNALLALPVAIAWILIILTVDRWIVTALPLSRSRKWSVIVPRVLLAILLGVIISTPIVLRIFQPEIDRQIVVIKQQQSDQFVSLLQNSASGQQTQSLRNEIDTLQATIGADGFVPTNPASDPQIVQLNNELSHEQALEQRYYSQWVCALYGGPGCPSPASGPLAQAAQQSYNAAKTQVNTLTSDIQARQQQLAANDQDASTTRLHQAEAALPGIQAELNAAENNLASLEDGFAAVNDSSSGLLLRLQALSQLSGQSLPVSLARWLVFLLFVAIECLPVAVKLVQHDDVYEEILYATMDQELREAKRAIRSGHYTAPAGHDVGLIGGDVAPFWGLDRALPNWAQPDWMTAPVTDVAENMGGIAELLRERVEADLPTLEDLRSLPYATTGATELTFIYDDPPTT
jgi:hypothetical protein